MTNNEHRSVLAVEDEAMIAMELADMLGDLGYVVMVRSPPWRTLSLVCAARNRMPPSST